MLLAGEELSEEAKGLTSLDSTFHLANSALRLFQFECTWATMINRLRPVF